MICLKDNRSSKEERILTLNFWWVFFLNDLKNTIRSFLFQMKDKTEQDLFLVNELSINWLLISKREIILLFVSRRETELLLASALRIKLLLVSELKTELLLLSEWETRLLLASKLKTELLFSSEWKIKLLLASELSAELLLVSDSWTGLLLVSELRARLRESYFVNFEQEIFFLLIKIIDLDEEWETIIKTEEERQDENIMLKININDVMMKLW